MPIQKSARREATKTLALALGEDTLTIAYRKHRFTPNYQRELTRYEMDLRRAAKARDAAGGFVAGEAAPGDENAAAVRTGPEESLAGVQGTAKMLADLIASWDYLGDDGHPLPITESELLEMDVTLLNAISSAIIADINPGQPTAAERADDPNFPTPSAT